MVSSFMHDCIANSGPTAMPRTGHADCSCSPLMSNANLWERVSARVKAHKAKAEAVRTPDVFKALQKEKQIVTGDAATLDACAAWYNLVGRVVESIPSAKVIRLQ